MTLDITHHIISDLRLREPDSYADTFKVLFESKIISENTRNNGKLMAQFRNRLVHYYEKNDPEIIFGILKKHPFTVITKNENRDVRKSTGHSGYNYNLQYQSKIRRL